MPPESWSCCLSPDARTAQLALDQLNVDFRRLLKLEASEAPLAQELAADCRILLTPSVRLVPILVQCGRVPEAQLILHHVIGGFADSKVVEDIHSALRTATGPKSNQKLSGHNIQFIVNSSQAIEKRGLNHPAGISKEKFLSLWAKTKITFKKKQAKASTHRLAKEWSQILCPKTWAIHSEEQFIKSVGAWKWLNHYCNANLSSHGVPLKAWDSIFFHFSCAEVSFNLIILA